MNDEISPLPTSQFPTEGRIAAVDYGTVRIGIAICDPDRILASPLEVHPVTQPDAGGYEADEDYFSKLASSERVAAWVVGLPIHCDGGESDKSVEARKFAEWLQRVTRLPTRLFDERFTTVAANQKIRQSKTTRKKTKKRIDAIAAQVLLESFLEACRYRGELAGHALDDVKPAGESLAD
ncbi:Holliday junction resolvase RuvX [Rhodopirellula sallentina]|uniref:Putative pre-16S rRNA nuclease n=1 Tax=Rhodopirellula sallentina SM41 TaxID=1263870 RepID=M5UFH2_9BACT|nr:Holliday junction resolvase RuvX [Rhodopirellula sallentina]EMI56601.1 Resolvase, holliday junction-type, YqgF-like protein [Rhodopirellula sallentina SM41]